MGDETYNLGDLEKQVKRRVKKRYAKKAGWLSLGGLSNLASLLALGGTAYLGWLFCHERDRQDAAHRQVGQILAPFTQRAAQERTASSHPTTPTPPQPGGSNLKK